MDSFVTSLPIDFGAQEKELYSPPPIQQQHQLKEEDQTWILCCSCGTQITPNPAALCLSCLTQSTDITQGIPKQAIVHYCRNCGRYLNPPNQWVSANLESKELLTLLVKRLRGLNKVKLKDAGFVWTEPHSKRIKLKLTVQKEVLSDMTLQQTFIVEYTVAGQQCEGCTRVMAEQSWRAQVQVRQKVHHPRTFYFLEQLILKHQLHKTAIQIKQVKEGGLDFFFQHRSHAIQFANAISSMLPATQKASEQLISTDIQNSTTNTRFTYAVELLPICKDDVICLTKKQDHQLGGLGPLFLCLKVHSGFVFLNPFTLSSLELSVKQFLRSPFTSIVSSKSLTEFYVLEVECTGYECGKYGLAHFQVARSSDHQVFSTRSHLGYVLKPGDLVLGYDLSTLNINHEAFERYYDHQGQCEEVILVKKTYPKEDSSKTKKRAWKLKSLPKTMEEVPMKKESNQEYELFLQELEEDSELRSEIQLYKDPIAIQQLQSNPQFNSSSSSSSSSSTFVQNESGRPEVPLEELLEDLHIDDTAEPDEPHSHSLNNHNPLLTHYEEMDVDMS